MFIWEHRKGAKKTTMKMIWRAHNLQRVETAPMAIRAAKSRGAWEKQTALGFIKAIMVWAVFQSTHTVDCVIYRLENAGCLVSYMGLRMVFKDRLGQYPVGLNVNKRVTVLGD
jgi:hypothetical protein